MKYSLPETYGEQSSEATNKLVDQINCWLKYEHNFSAAEIDLLLWALSVDDELQQDFHREYLRRRAAKQALNGNA